jgi:SAM-dependent methyltransferase
MPETDRERWNQRYRNEGYDFTPPAWLRQLEPDLREHPPDARALDVATGGGRSALYLAELGYHVDAWDVSDVGLEYLRQELARRADVGQSLVVEPRQVDLEIAPLPESAYDLILDAHYLERRLFDQMKRALRVGGRLIVHTFLFVSGGPTSSRLSNPLYALQPGELVAAFGDLEILDLAEDRTAETAHLLARRTRL